MGTKKEAMVMPVEYVICSWGWPARKPVALFPMKCCGEVNTKLCSVCYQKQGERLTMHQMATPPMVMAEPSKRRLWKRHVSPDTHDGGRHGRGGLLVVEALARGATVDELDGGGGADEADGEAQGENGGIEVEGDDLAQIAGEAIVVGVWPQGHVHWMGGRRLVRQASSRDCEPKGDGSGRGSWRPGRSGVFVMSALGRTGRR